MPFSFRPSRSVSDHILRPHPVVRGVPGPLQRLADGVHRARPQREADVVQPLGGARTSRTCSWSRPAVRHQRPVLLPGLQAEVLQEAFGYGQVWYFQRVMMQP